MTQKIDSKDLDVIVIGAGPAGGSTARELAKLGRKVLLIERSQEIGEPNYSTAGTPKETVEEFDLPESVLSATWNRILFATPRVSVDWKYEGIGGYVFDFAALRKFLAEDAANHGAEIMVGTAVEDFIEKDGRIAGVRYHGALGSGEACAKIIVDATGHNELSNNKLGINAMPGESLGTAMEYVMTKIPPELKDTMGFYVGSEYSYRGYSWIFPMSKNLDAKVGTCTLGPMPEGKKLDDILGGFINRFPFFSQMEPLEIHAGAARADGGVRNHVYKNLMLVGDSAHQVHPVFGEGIRHCLVASRLAASAIDDWLNSSLADLGPLKKIYEEKWKRQFARTWKLSRVFIEKAADFNDKQIDEFMVKLRQLNSKEFYDLLFNYKVSFLLKRPALAQQLLKIGLFK